MLPRKTGDHAADRPRLLVVLGILGALLIVVGLIIALRGEPTPTTTTAVALPTTSASTITTASTTTEPPTTLTTIPAKTTTTPPIPQRTEYDVIVVGDGLGGSTAAVVAARLGADTLLLSPIGYFGGQAGAAGVSTMDEGGNRYVLRRSGIYEELVNFVTLRYAPRGTGSCYFIEDPMCPEPSVVDEFFRNLLGTAGVDVVTAPSIIDVVQQGNIVGGVISDGVVFRAPVVIDATEFSDLYPLIEGLEYEVGDSMGCVQDTTWLAIRSWYSTAIAPFEVVPAEDAIDDLRAMHGASVDEWLAHFRGSVVPTTTGLSGGQLGELPWDLATETAYRALADSRGDTTARNAPAVTRTAVNYANDSALSVAAIEDPVAREQEFRKALHITYGFLWYLRWELGVADWGVSNDMQFSKGTRLFWDDLVPDDIEANLPPIPYVREARRMVAVYNLSPEDLGDSVRSRHRFDDAVMLGGYFTDFHGCQPPDGGSGYGLFEVPMDVFIPQTIDGFLPGIARAAGVSRAAAAAVRTQPEEMWGGQVAGTIAGLAVAQGVEPREVGVEAVQNRLRETGLVFFLPA